MYCVGVIFNPGAGRSSLFHAIGELLSQKLEAAGCRVITASGPFGARYIPKATQVIPLSSADLPSAFRAIVTAFVDQGANIIAGVGGDGTLNLLATQLLHFQADVALMGIAGGTANVGPLIRFNIARLQEFDLRKLYTYNLSPLEIWLDKDHIGYAFVDVVIGDTFLGTFEGRLETFSASKFLKEGMKEPQLPSQDLGCFIVKKGKHRFEVKHIAQIVASPLYHVRFYSGKAITGALCWAPFLEAAGAVVWTTTPIIDPRISPSFYPEPVNLGMILLRPEDRVEISGTARSACIIVDGNPLDFLGDKILTILVSKRKLQVVSPRPFEEDCYPLGL
jgi:hypothetical protein